ncbi:hypothetical protein CSC70_05485 [Pseudoxanthomonas kalamensis DSM 18571]|uniref:DUF2339 domain-containing protein n=1 Tax=Pseudoxanthomonas kalamensis TaxID=289483 RepID=UPI001391AD54|nr:DUF2339 domain-containing protein [Pseudoxanthomonas kalamensis]KAF1711537.1 hypothetical protein CSC70_05485 [Pseudoxanthomonas kalamensis DSM 18571]
MAAILTLIGLAVLAVPVLLVVALVSLSRLKGRVGALESELAQWRASAVPSHGEAATAAEPEPEFEPEPAPLSDPQPESPVESPADVETAAPGLPPPLPPEPARPVAAAASKPKPIFETAPATPARPDPFTLGLRAAKRWLTVGNVPVKIGMLVLFAGVAALLKYASDQGWLRMPIELRLAGIAAAAMAGLVFGWRKRLSNRSFALSLQGGMIGILLLVAFAAFRRYELIPASAAFAFSVVLIAGAGMLAVLQNSRALAVFALLAGFLAPIWLSTGSGNHVALFSYYAVLNAAILVIAWWRPWRVLNLLGFVFTFGIGTLWGVLDYAPDKYASTQPFLLLFFAFYLLIPLLYARRRPASRRDFIDGCLVFGTPLVAFSLQAALLHDQPRMTLALWALGLAALYAVLARIFIHRERYAALGQSYALLAVGFATLAVPLALSARATASVFALEGAALVWLGLRQRRWLPQLTGAGLQLAAAFALLLSMAAWSRDTVAFANPTFMGALLLAVAGFASAAACRNAGKPQYAAIYYLWALAWWCFALMREVFEFMPREWNAEADALLALAALSGWLAAEAHRRRPALLLALTTLAAFALAAPLALAQTAQHDQPFAGHGVWAWLAFALLGVRSLLCLRAAGDRFAAWAQFVWWLVWPLAASLLLGWLSGHLQLAEGWSLLGLALPWLLVAALAQFRWPWLAAPLGSGFDPLRRGLMVVLFVVLGFWWMVAVFSSGDSAPLPWLPLLNPIELGQLAVLALAAHWLWSAQAPTWLRPLRVFKMAAAGFLLVTSITLHAVHHWGGLGWDADLLSSGLAQTSLTVVWSVLGVIGWVIGSRRGNRGLWLAGALLMAVVLVKLVLVDRGNLGNVLGIASFIAYGLLCTLVGYFAPAPPRKPSEETQA